MTTTFSGEPVRLLFIIVSVYQSFNVFRFYNSFIVYVQTYTRLDHPDEGPQTTELLSFPFRVDTSTLNMV